MIRTIFIAAALCAASALSWAAATNSAVVKTFTGDVVITTPGGSANARKYQLLSPGMRVTVGRDSSVELLFASGKRLEIVSGVSVEITANGVKPLDKASEDFIRRYSAVDIYSSMDLAGNRDAIVNVPDKVKKEIAEMEKTVTNAALLTLLKGDIYKTYRLGKRAKDEFWKHVDATNMK